MVRNQLINPTKSGSSFNIQFEKQDDLYLVTGTVSNPNSFYNMTDYNGNYMNLVTGDVYLLRIDRNNPGCGVALFNGLDDNPGQPRALYVGAGVGADITETVFRVASAADNTWIRLQVNIAYATVGSQVNCSIKTNLIDLTRMFGAEVASTITTPEQAYSLGLPREYMPFDLGTVVSAGVIQVVSRGANILRDNMVFSEQYYERTVSKVIPVKRNTDYFISVSAYNVKPMFSIKGLRPAEVERVVSPYTSWSIGTQIGALTNTVNTGNYDYITFRSWATDSQYGIPIDAKFCVSENDTYSQYTEYTLTVPESIRSLPGYGETGANVDFEHKVYTAPNGTKTDISGLLPDDLYLEVEEGGAVMFEQSGNLALPVPYKLTFFGVFDAAIRFLRRVFHPATWFTLDYTPNDADI